MNEMNILVNPFPSKNTVKNLYTGTQLFNSIFSIPWRYVEKKVTNFFPEEKKRKKDQFSLIKK